MFRLALALTLVARVASAQPGEPPPPVEAAAQLDPAQHDYDAAFDLLVGGDLGTAASRFDDVAGRASDPGLANRARELARLSRTLIGKRVRFAIGPEAAVTTHTDKDDGAADKDDKVDGRTSFIVWTTMYGLYAGVVLIDDANIDDFRGGVLAVTATTALGLFGSYLGTDGRTMTGSMADSYTLGMIEGFANGGLLAHPLGLTTSSEQTQTTLLLSGGAGAIAGLAYGYEVKPTRGQIAFAGTLSVLGAASTGLGIGIGQPDFDGDKWATTIAIGTDAGLVAGLGFGRNLDWSVSRGRIVQLGVLLGGLVGLAAGALINGDHSDNGNDTARLISATSLAGMWGGFGIAVRATSNMRPDRQYAPAGPNVNVAPMGVRGGGGAMLTGTF
jgi:hypothetical protein